ncbi:MAG TPA: response regulator [Candidatus Limnocylindrales bacterium]|nr:response regulator [Candidatus Limnocylindrales bacterium]
MKVLLVEPDHILGETAKNSLAAHNHEVVLTRSAQHALDALDNKMPDIIILELQLGLHNGIEFLYEIRSYPEWQHIPVIVHTLNSRVLGERFNNALNQLGVAAVLYKPRTSAKKLAQAVGQFVAI